MKTYTIYTDGGSRGNPGPAGAGAVIQNEAGETIKGISEFLGKRTNNFAEYEAVILALEALKRIVPGKERGAVSVEVKMDSQLIQRQLTNQYQIKEETLFPKFIAVHNLMVKDFPNIKFTHIPREKNKEADKLANDAMDRV